MIEPEDAIRTSEAAVQTPGQAHRQRDRLILLRDHLEQLLCALLNAMPRSDVESLLAGCGSSELIQFGRPAAAAAVVTAMLQNPGDWTSVREALRRGCRRGHDGACSPTAQEEAAGLAEQLLDRLDFGLAMYERMRASLDSANRQPHGGAARKAPEGMLRT